MEKLLDIRYPPYIPAKLLKFRKMSGKKPNFDRDGNEIKGFGYWISFLGALGSESTKVAVVRWTFLLLAAVGLKAVADKGVLSELPWVKK
jgi:beta-apo-4'-carotenal oxygenase